MPMQRRLSEEEQRVITGLRRLLRVALAETMPADSDVAQLVEDSRRLFRNNYERTAFALHRASDAALKAVNMRRRFEATGDASYQAELAAAVKEAKGHLAYLGISAKKPQSAPAPKKKKKITNAEAPPPGSAKRLATFEANFKKAQESLLPKSAIAKEQKWVKRAKPQDVEGVIVEEDDHVLGIYLNERTVDRVEERDAQAMEEWAAGYRPPCPIADYKVRNTYHGFVVDAYVQDAEGEWTKVGLLEAKDTGEGEFISGFSDVPLPTLAACPGLGNGLYLEAAKEACKRDGVLMASDHRSVFSEYFWQKQIKNKRATCRDAEPEPRGRGDDDDDYYDDDAPSDEGVGAMYYPRPAQDAVDFLKSGQITVPQYNELRRRMPRLDPYTEKWDCNSIPLKKSWCRLPENEKTLRGIRARGRGRYRLTSALPAPRYKLTRGR